MLKNAFKGYIIIDELKVTVFLKYKIILKGLKLLKNWSRRRLSNQLWELNQDEQ